MRTRRSPRNQDRLWTYLSGKPEKVQTPTLAERAARLEKSLAEGLFTPRTRRQLETDLAKIRAQMATH